MKRLSRIGAFGVAAAVVLGASAASAATIGFETGTEVGNTYTEDGFVLTSSQANIQIPDGNCGSEVSPDSCLQLNNDEVVTLTFGAGTTAFDLTSFLYNLNGGGAELTVTYANNPGSPLTFTQPQSTCVPPTSGGQCQTLAQVNFDDVLSVTFAHTGTGTIRLDDIVASTVGINPTTPVPAPAAGLLLLGALGATGLVRRRRKAT